MRRSPGPRRSIPRSTRSSTTSPNRGASRPRATCPTARSRACRSCSRTSAPRTPESRSIWGCNCSRTRTSPHRSTRRLRSASAQAGLITFGKTNTPELGIVATTEPKAYGATRNPWDTSRSPGGSSGGSGAAVAAGIVPMAHANDGGGSIRIPASNNGLVGLKPTRQRISEGPMVGDVMSGVTVELCVSRSVRDTARLLEAVHGAAPGDPYVAPAPLRPYTDELDDESGGLRIGILDHSLIEGVEVAAPCVEAVRDCGEAGRVAGPLDRRRVDRRRAADRRGRSRPRGQLPDPLGGRAGGDADSARDADRSRRSPRTTSRS